MSAETVRKFVDSFPALTKLESLYIDDNEFGSDGCLSLAAAIAVPHLPNLKLLSACCCEITGKGALTLTRCLLYSII